MEVLLEDLTDRQREWMTCRAAHLLEVETGFRGGSVLVAAPGEPRAAYDPVATTLAQRRRAKVEELRSLGDQAWLLGFAQVSVRTLERMAAAYAREGLMGLVDRRWVPWWRALVGLAAGGRGDRGGARRDAAPFPGEHAHHGPDGAPVRRRRVRAGCGGTRL